MTYDAHERRTNFWMVSSRFFWSKDGPGSWWQEWGGSMSRNEQNAAPYRNGSRLYSGPTQTPTSQQFGKPPPPSLLSSEPSALESGGAGGMASWLWPWRQREERKAAHDEVAGQMRQDSAIALAELRQRRRSLDRLITEAMATQAERVEDD